MDYTVGPGGAAGTPEIDETNVSWKIDFTKPCKSTGSGAIDVTKPYKSIGFGAIEINKLTKRLILPFADAWRAAAALNFA